MEGGPEDTQTTIDNQIIFGKIVMLRIVKLTISTKGINFLTLD